MQLKLSIKIPSSSRAAITSKVTSTFGRALQVARVRIIPLVIDRASQVVDKQVPAFARRYKAALNQAGAVEVTDKEVTIDLKDPVVIAVERGMKGFDMKAKLLARFGKPSKDGGTYVDIPFQHKAGEVPHAMRAAAARASKDAGGAATVRLSMKTEGKAFTRQLQRGRVGQALGLSPKKQQVKHKRGVHDDLVRSARPTGGGSSSVRYTTIRRISSRSASSSWWHPGFKARRVLDNVLTGVKKEIASILRDAFSTVRSGDG